MLRLIKVKLYNELQCDIDMELRANNANKSRVGTCLYFLSRRYAKAGLSVALLR